MQRRHQVQHPDALTASLFRLRLAVFITLASLGAFKWSGRWIRRHHQNALRENWSQVRHRALRRSLNFTCVLHLESLRGFNCVKQFHRHADSQPLAQVVLFDDTFSQTRQLLTVIRTVPPCTASRPKCVCFQTSPKRNKQDYINSLIIIIV